jgi:hypothetical protein
MDMAKKTSAKQQVAGVCSTQPVITALARIMGMLAGKEKCSLEAKDHLLALARIAKAAK